jgi:hypothetical protein
MRIQMIAKDFLRFAKEKCQSFVMWPE